MGSRIKSSSEGTNRGAAPSVPPRVLLVEDGTIGQVLGAETLRALACEAVIVADGEAAVRQSAQERFDLILMDCELPGIDGLEATRQIRRGNGSSSAAPIIALTGNDEADYQQRCLAAGMNGLIAKPLSLRTLDEVLRRYLPKCGHPSAPAGAAASAALTDTEPGRSETVIDRKALDAIRALQRPQAPNLLGLVINNFAQHASKLLNDIDQGLRSNDAAAVKDAAHGLKSSAATVGAKAVAAHSKEMESFAQQGDLDNARSLWQRLLLEHGRAQQALSQAANEFER